MTKEYTPIIIGAAQYLQPKNTKNPLDPLKLIVKTSRMALEDTGSEILKDYIDSVYMVNINSWSYKDAPGQLSEILGITPETKVFLPDGGDTPQMLTNRAAKAIASGKIKAVLITGGEAEYTAHKLKKDANYADWPALQEPEYMEGPLWDGINEYENRYGFKVPPYTYALFETAVRANAKRSLKEHKKVMGKIFQRFSTVASQNPHSWDNTAYKGEDITNPSPENRYINHPYTKRMCSNMFVDQSASIIMTSDTLAKELNINQDKWIYLMGGADLKDIHEISRRPVLYDSIPMRDAARLALQQAGLSIDEIDAFELYSCFPSIVQIMMNEMGLDLDDPRPLTFTGGMPFFGGPWSNYTMHGIVAAIEHVRKSPSTKIMVVANGGYNSKKSVGIYGKIPPKIAWTERDDSKIQEQILKRKLPDSVKEAEGLLTIEAYTIPYDRDGNPKYSIVIGHLEDGRKTIASSNDEPQVLLKYEEEELIGKTFPVHFNSVTHRNVIQLK